MSIDGKSVGLALSGGGFRASLFGLGSLWRLNEAGILGRLDYITSVSGGSIVSGVLAHRWKQLQFVGGRATNFEELVVQPIRRFCAEEEHVEPGLKGLLTPIKLMRKLAHDVDVNAGVKGWLTPGKSAGDYLIQKYNEELFHDATLRDLPPAGEGAPVFTFYATNMQTGRSFRMQQDQVFDYKLGFSKRLVLPLAQAVAASSAFPPLFSPIILESDPADWEDTPPAADGSRMTLVDTKAYKLADLRARVVLADGGIYDNLGLQRLVGASPGKIVVLCSDAGAPFDIEPDPHEDPVRQLGRVRDILIDQTRALRKNRLIYDFQNQIRMGAYWGVATDIGDYATPGTLAAFKGDPGASNDELDDVPTRLSGFDDEMQARLINWGYALCDAALRSPRSSAGLTVEPATALPVR